MTTTTKPTLLVDVTQEDHLDQDPDLRGQKYACVSFISPEDALLHKDAFFISEFTKHLAGDVSTMLDNLSTKFKDDQDVQDMVRAVRERHEYLATPEAMDAEYRMFKDTHNDRLESAFYEQNEFRTSIRGLKIRGVYESLKEAQKRAEAIKVFDKNFDVWIAEVGCWCPWNPNPHAREVEQQFPEAELNTLMSKYKENQDKRDALYAERKESLVAEVKKAADRNRPAPVTIVEEAGPSE